MSKRYLPIYLKEKRQQLLFLQLLLLMPTLRLIKNQGTLLPSLCTHTNRPHAMLSTYLVGNEKLDPISSIFWVVQQPPSVFALWAKGFSSFFRSSQWPFSLLLLLWQLQKKSRDATASVISAQPCQLTRRFRRFWTIFGGIQLRVQNNNQYKIRRKRWRRGVCPKWVCHRPGVGTQGGLRKLHKVNMISI